MFKRFLGFIFLLLIGYAHAQEHARVYFKDKENVNASINNPITILTQKAFHSHTDVVGHPVFSIDNTVKVYVLNTRADAEGCKGRAGRPASTPSSFTVSIAT